MKLIPVLVLIGIGGVLAGCGAGSPTVPVDLGSGPGLARSIAARIDSAPTHHPPGTPLRFRETEYSALVYNPGTVHAFTAFATLDRDVTVQPSSAASVRTTPAGLPVLTTAEQRAAWQAAGRPELTDAPADGQTTSFPPNGFSFMSQGTPLTYQQAGSLPTSPDDVRAAVRAHLRGGASAEPPATQVLRQLGFLLATAPLTDATRSAMWRTTAALPGLHLCGSGDDRAGRRGEVLCVTAGEEESDLLVDPRTGAALEVRERIRQRSWWYPGVAPGSTIDSDTFPDTAPTS